MTTTPKPSRIALVALLPTAGRGVTLGVLATTLLAGVLTPAFMVASGWVVSAATGRRSLTWPLVVATALFVLIHLLGPIRDALADFVMGRLDARLALRVMRAVGTPRSIGHLEDPAVLDAISQVHGGLVNASPGQGAYYVSMVWAQRFQAGLSLLIVARFRWWVAVGLAVVHAASFRFRRWHYLEVTNILYSRTDVLRGALYIRELAVESAAAKETRVFGLADWLVDRYRSSFLASIRDIWHTRASGGWVALGVAVVLLLAEGWAMVLVGDAALSGGITVAAAVVYAQAIVAASNLGAFQEGHLIIEEGLGSLALIQRLEATMPEAVRALPGHRPADGMPRHRIRFEGVAFHYPGRDEVVFEALDLDIEAGRSLAIVGENGAGKTTLVKLLARLYEPTGGRITVDGTDLRDIDPEQWQHRVAAIFQDFVQYHLPAYDNVAFGALHRRAERDLVVDAAVKAGAAPIIEALPCGWDTTLSRQFTDGADLSGGEWQRVALARAMFSVAGGAGVLILDEPTAALDVRGEAAIYEKFLDLTHGVTTIVISHRFSTVRRADRIVVLEHGRVIEDGTHDELMGLDGRYAAMYTLQAERFRTGGVNDG